MELSRTLIRTDKNGTKIYNVVRTCYRCGGSGRLACYNHVEAGICFACNGSGHEEAIEKVYAEEYLNRKAARAEAKEAARKASWTPEAELAKMGYGEMIGIVTNMEGRRDYGDDFQWLTRDYDCKYEKGCSGLLTARLDRIIENICCPTCPKYQIVPVRWDELLDADYENCHLTWKDHGAASALKAHTYNFPPCPKFESAFVGAEGEKVTVNVRLQKVGGFESQYGYTNVYTFEDKDHNLLVWKTGTSLDLKVGAYAALTGTVKEHSEYRDTKQTVLTRCKLAAV